RRPRARRRPSEPAPRLSPPPAGVATPATPARPTPTDEPRTPDPTGPNRTEPNHVAPERSTGPPAGAGPGGKAKPTMDQLKEILKQAIKYRFWIAVGLSALLPLIAYFVGVGAVKTQAKAQSDAIEAAEKDVKQYASGNVINDQYQPVVAEKTG